MKMEMKSRAVTVVQYTRRHMRELGMKNNVMSDSQPWEWRGIKEFSFPHRGLTRVSVKKSEKIRNKAPWVV